MVTPAITDDYHAILGVEQTATPGEIIKSYKRLALLHTRMEIYAQFDRGIPACKGKTLRKLVEDNKGGAIFELERDIRKLENLIWELEDIEQVERVEEDAAKSWTAWLLSPLFQKPVQTEEEMEGKARDRLQRLHSKNFISTDLEAKEQLRDYEDLLKSKRQEFDDANRKDDMAKSTIEQRMRAERKLEQREKELVEEGETQRAWEECIIELQREEAAREAKKQADRRETLVAEQRKRKEVVEAARKVDEGFRKRQEAARASETYPSNHRERQELRERSRYEEREWTFPGAGGPRYSSGFHTNYYPSSSSCTHDSWWPNVEGHSAC